MNKLNNKGFAISTMLYGLLIILILIITTLMSTMSFNRKNSKEFTDTIVEELEKEDSDVNKKLNAKRNDSNVIIPNYSTDIVVYSVSTNSKDIGTNLYTNTSYRLEGSFYLGSKTGECSYLRRNPMASGGNHSVYIGNNAIDDSDFNIHNDNTTIGFGVWVEYYANVPNTNSSTGDVKVHIEDNLFSDCNSIGTGEIIIPTDQSFIKP